MATISRVEPKYTSWAPSTAGFGETIAIPTDEYVGKHRRPGLRLGLFTMFYRGRHRRP